MMPRPIRRILASLLVAFHATVMLCGPCLHELPGWGHEASGPRGGEKGEPGLPGKPSHASTHDCPVCHFLAQGQLPVEVDHGVVFRPIGSLTRPDPPAISAGPRHHPSSPRAPPTAHAVAA